MATHHRRKALRKALTEMYLENIRRAKTYTDLLALEGYLSAVTESQIEAQLRQAKEQEHDFQYPLF